MISSKTAATLALCATALLFTACSKSSEELLALAKVSLEKNDSKAAVLHLKSSLQLKPNVAEARFLLGKALLQSGEQASAAAELQRAIDLGYPPVQAVPPLLEALLATQQFKEMTDQYSDADFPDKEAMAQVKTRLAAAYASQGNPQKASAYAEEALLAQPDYSPALVLKARLLAQAKKVDEAFGLADKVVSANPSDPDAWYLKGELLGYFRQDREGAKSAYAQAISVKPDFIAPRTAIISLLLSQGDLKQAGAQIEELRKLSPRLPQVAYFDAHMAYLQRDNAKARQLTLDLLKYAPRSPQVLQLAGAVAYNSNSLVQAQNYLEKALYEAPDLPVARALLARTHLRSGQPERALKTLSPILDSKQPTAEALSIAGQAQLQLRQPKLAEASFARAAQINPKDTKTLTALALTRMTDGNATQTFDDLRTISAQDDEPYADLALISTLLRKREFDQALGAIDALEKKQPGKPLAENLRGRLFLMRGDVAQARSSFERALALDPVHIPAVAALADLDMADKKPEAARKRFDSVLAVDPKNVQALLAVAGLKARAGASPQETSDALASAIKLNPTEPAPRLVLINHLLAQQDAKAALTAAQAGVSVLPENLELVDALGRAQMATGDIKQAASSFKKLISLKPDAPEPHLRLAMASLAAREPAEAKKSLLRSIELAPGFVTAQTMLVELLIAEKLPNDAMQVARTVQKQRPGEATGFLLEGLVEVSRNRPAAAADIYKAALVKFPTGDIAAKYHAALHAQKKEADASGFAATWLSSHPKDAVFMAYLGESALRDLNLVEAEKRFEAALQISPSSAALLNNLAWVKIKLKKPGALELAQKSNELARNSPMLMDTLAMALAANQRVDDALVLQKKALALAPDSPTLKLTLARIYLQSGDEAAARKTLEPLVKLPARSPERAEAMEILAALKG